MPTVPVESPAQAVPPLQAPKPKAPSTGIELAKEARKAQEAGALEQAIKLYGEALAARDLSDENSAVVLSNMGIVHWAEGEPDAAIADYDRALALQPHYADALQNRALAYEAKGRIKDAIAGYGAALALQPGDAFALENRGRTELYAGQLKEAVSDFTQALALASGDGYAVLWLHIARATSGQDDDFEFRQNARSVDLATWPGPILSLYLGTTTFDNLRLLVDAAPDQGRQTVWACEANFYGGVLLRLEKSVESASEFFKQAETYCAPSAIERLAAKAELARLSK